MMMNGLMRVWESVWQMSLTGGFVCVLICLVRLLIKKAPKSYAYALWAVVFLRFVCPVGFSGSFSLIPQWERLDDRLQSMMQEQEDRNDQQNMPGDDGLVGGDSLVGGDNVGIENAGQSGNKPSDTSSGTQMGTVLPNGSKPGSSSSDTPTFDVGHSQGQTSGMMPSQGSPVTPGVQQGNTPTEQTPNVPQTPNASQTPTVPQTPHDPTVGIPSVGLEEELDRQMTATQWVVIVWLTGILGIAVVQMVRTHRWKVRLGLVEHTLDRPVSTGDPIHEIPGLATPFVMGFWEPQIYLPVGMDQGQRQYVLRHEQAHIRRKDYLIKGIAFAITCVHWFNPLAWLAYYLMCMDMEMSCDESVLADMEGSRKEYAQALLAFAEQSAGGGLAFGEPYAMRRIRNVLNYRRPVFKVSVILTILCLVISGCLMTDPKQTEEPETDEQGEIIVVDREEETTETEKIQETQDEKESSGAQTTKPSDRLNQDKNKEDESEDEGPLPVLDEALLQRLNTYPQADAAVLEYFDRLFEDPYYLAFTAPSYTSVTEEIVWNVAAALADQLGSESEISDGEIQRLKDAGMNIELDLIWVTTEDIMNAWQQCSETELTMTQLRNDMAGWYYLSDLDRWYMQTGGVMVEPIECLNVLKWGTLTHVIYQCQYSDVWGEILLRGNEKNGYRVVTHQRRYSDHFEELYAPEDFYATAVRNMEERRKTWFNGMLNVDHAFWFGDYQGGTLEVLDGVYEIPYGYQEGETFYWYESPMYCDDIVYYRPEGDETIDQIAVTMMEAMVERMTVPSEVRPFTITQYRITEKQVNSLEITLRELWEGYRFQTMLHGEIETWEEYLEQAVVFDGRAPIGEDMWYFIPRGDYAFDGVGLLGMTMADEIQLWPEGYQDGMIPFQAQGGDSVFLFLLMKQGDVYRLQRMQGMLESFTEIKERPKEPSVADTVVKDDAYYDQAEAHWQSFYVGSTDPIITKDSVSWYADLDHDGEQDERILFDWGYMDPGTYGIFAVMDEEGTVVYVQDPATSHTGFMNYYLCELDGRQYLLNYAPYLGGGGADYGYSLLELSSEKEIISVDQGSASFIPGDGEFLAQFHSDWVMDIEAMVDFAEAANGYLSHSRLLFSTDQDWLGEAIADSETGMFVIGSYSQPYRQYENYHWLSEETSAATAMPTRQELWDMLVSYCERAEVPYMKMLSWYADLTHDGQPEKIVFDWTDFTSGDEGSFTVLDSQGQPLFADEIYSGHGGSSTYYLCQWQGQDYLFYYKPYVIMGEGHNSYELFSLSEQGDKLVADSGSVRFHVEFLPGVVNEYGKRAINIPEMTAFADTINEYINASYLLVCSDKDWIRDIPYEKDQYFVAGSPEVPYRQQETYHWYDDFEVELGQNFGEIEDVAAKLKAWCIAADIPYVE